MMRSTPGWIRSGCVAVAAAVVALAAPAAAPLTEVFVIGSLYRQHENVPAYSLDTLRRVIVAIDPQVLVLDCTPAEIASQSVHASKIEYVRVVFPLMRERALKAYAAEPGEPMFTEIVQSIIQASETLRRTSPDTATALDQFRKASDATLFAYWQSPAHVHDDVTARFLAGREALNNRILGSVAENGSTKWNRYWTDSIVKAAHENPGKRILAITGIQNRSWILEALKGAEDIHVVDTTKWLRDREHDLRGN